MITTAAFHSHKPDKKRQLILEGMEHLSAQYAELAVTAKKLNAWLDHVNIAGADKEYIKRFQALAFAGPYNADKLTEQILISSEKIRAINDIISKQLIHNIK